MYPEISPPDYLPDGVTAWAEENRSLLELIVEELIATGSWPGLKETTRKLAREGNPIPLERVLGSMPRPLGSLDTGPDRRIVLFLYGLRMTHSGHKLLAGFAGALRIAKERYAAEDDDDPVLSRADISQGTVDTDPYVNALGEVLLREAPFLGSGSGEAHENWTREITPSIVQYWDATDAEIYLRTRTEELKVVPQLGWDPSPQLLDTGIDNEDKAALGPDIEAVEQAPNPSYDVFISHASEDKDSVARPLEQALAQRGWATWLDELKLTVGDSLSERIDAALAHSRFGVVVLSPAFFSKPWAQRELAGLAAREIDMGSKVILPVWHHVDHHFIVQRSPVLADRLGVQTSVGIENVAEEISLAIEGSGTPSVQHSSPSPLAQAVDADEESDGEVLLQIPTTREAQASVIAKRPDFWEYQLFAGKLMEGRLTLESKWRDHELRLPGGVRRDLGQESPLHFLNREMGWLQRQISSISRIFTPFEEAVGQPGQPGDANRIEHLAGRYLQMYEGIMDWAADLRNTNAPSDYEEIVELYARLADGPVRQMRSFVQEIADQTARLPALAEGSTEENPATVHFELTLSLEDGVEDELLAALDRLRNS